MPRRKTNRIEKMLLTDSWQTFGLWLRSRRIAKRFSQEQAAQAAGVSRRQWIRYEHGSKILLKNLPAIADALDVPLRRILYLAGHKTSPRRNDANHRLRRIHHMLHVGNLDDALEELLLLHDRIWRTEGTLSSDLDGLTALNFARALILLDGLPEWLFEVILTCMQKRFSPRRKPTGMNAELRVLVLECIDEIERTVPALPQIALHSASVGSGRVRLT